MGKESLDHPPMPMKFWCSRGLMLFVLDKMEKASVAYFSCKLFLRLFCFQFIPLIPRKCPNMQCWENVQGTHWSDTWKQSIVVVIIQQHPQIFTGNRHHPSISFLWMHSWLIYKWHPLKLWQTVLVLVSCCIQYSSLFFLLVKIMDFAYQLCSVSKECRRNCAFQFSMSHY